MKEVMIGGYTLELGSDGRINVLSPDDSLVIDVSDMSANEEHLVFSTELIEDEQPYDNNACVSQSIKMAGYKMLVEVDEDSHLNIYLDKGFEAETADGYFIPKGSVFGLKEAVDEVNKMTEKSQSPKL